MTIARNGYLLSGVSLTTHVSLPPPPPHQQTTQLIMSGQFVHHLLNGCYEVTVHEGKGLPKTDNMGLTEGDPLCIVKDCRGSVLMRTKCIRKTRAPKWEEKGVVSIVEGTGIHFDIVDIDATTEERMCDVTLKASDALLAPLLKGKSVTGWAPLKKKGEIRFTVRPLFHQAPGSLGVQNSRFPSRQGCRLTLYQSAHIGCERDYLPRGLNIFNTVHDEAFGDKRQHANPVFDWQADDNAGGAREYVPRNAWEELYVSILSAKHFTYIVGWSVNVAISLLRERNIVVPGYEGLDGRHLTLGDLLQKKADEGVRVCIMLWREATSSAGGRLFESDGVAGTYSEQTKLYFRNKGGKVHVKTFLRESANMLALDKVAYTHHQKFVVLDAPSLAGSSKPRRVLGYLGGLDLTKGRFDTPKKHLYSTLQTWQKGDYYQNCFPGAKEGVDLMQPWQDVHCKVEGPIARDLVTNFEERWLKQNSEKWHGSLFKVDAEPSIIKADEDYVMDPDMAENWNIQLFRSIDYTSACNVLGIEGGIHNAYEHAITRAERFVYVENQYFMGGSKAWSAEVKKGKKESILNRLQALVGGEEVQAVNRIPILLMERISRAIREKKRFTAYVCIPLFPEGLPESAAMQEILYWQFRTMEMMYKSIKEVLISVGSGAKVTDYLNFYCLGNREPGGCTPEPGATRRQRVSQSCRHMVYVHSKFLVADDDYIILGSANINDRSMAGNRDTEIAIGAYQPYQSRDKGVKYPNGSVQAFRLSLWGEHLNQGATVHNSLYYPESKECVDYINARATQAWREHAQDAPTQQICHMMKYPITVADDGSVAPVQDCFPDAPGATIRGAESDTIPDFLTS